MIELLSIEPFFMELLADVCMICKVCFDSFPLRLVHGMHSLIMHMMSRVPWNVPESSVLYIYKQLSRLYKSYIHLLIVQYGIVHWAIVQLL